MESRLQVLEREAPLNSKLWGNPPASSSSALATMRANRRVNTGPELSLRTALRDVGILGYRIGLKAIPGRPDITFTRNRLAVFVHGCFWHRCPHCQLRLPKSNQDFWKRKFELNAERDGRKRRQLEALGWEVLEIWECEVKRDAAACAALVGETLQRIERHLEADDEVADLKGAKRAPIKRGTTGRS